MKKYKLRKPIKVIFIIVLLLFLILIFNITKNNNNSYSLEYKIDDFNIEENYDTKYGTYYFEVTYNKNKYPFVFQQKFINEKKLINDIEFIENNNTKCLNIQSDVFTSLPICYQDNNLIDYHLVKLEELEKYNESLSNTEFTLNNYTMYNDNYNILIWNYKGFNYIKNDKISEIKIFDKDIYDIPLHAKINNYILIPNYEEDYTFSSIYLLDTNTMKISNFSFNYNISFNSVFLGTNDKSIFLLDKQNKIEYELVPHKEKIRIVSSKKKGIIYEYNKSKKVSMTSLINGKSNFKYYNTYNYELTDNKLYLSYIDQKIKYQISNQTVDKIQFINNETILYLVKDDLYLYTPTSGEIKIMNYNEFNYNKNIPIYIN